jgi:predicted DNA-binding protein (UPF0251 family)/predicted Fe-Mo cluster-binding NifX family protein
MPRQKKCRNIENPPIYDGYRPVGVSPKHLDCIDLKLEEYEAIRLADYENLRQQDAAIRMNISRPTFTRIYNSARKKIAQAFVEGKMILFKGGNIEIDQQLYKCKDCNEIFKLKDNISLICTSCKSENIENLKQNNELWREEQASSTNKKEDVSCVYCNYTLSTNKKNQSCPQCGNRMQSINRLENPEKRKIAIPTENGKLCNHFGNAKYFNIYQIENKLIIKQETLKAPKHEVGALPKWLKSILITDVIAGGMGERALQLLDINNINTHTGIKEDDLDCILDKFLNGKLISTHRTCCHTKDNCSNYYNRH